MEKTRLGRTEMMVSRIGFGGIPIQRIAEDEAVAIVSRCLELGITYLDTANAYTTSEERIGRAIKGRRPDLILATKSSARTRDGIAEHLKLSLKQLGVDYIDLFQFHSIDSVETLKTVLDPNGPIAVIEDARKTGVIRHIGFSSHNMTAAKESVKTDRFETVMFPLNMVADQAANELLPLAREHDVGFIAMKPLSGGKIDNVSLAFKYLFQFPDVVPIPGIGKVKEIEEIVRLSEELKPAIKAEK